MTVRRTKTQISLGGCPGWSESSLSAWRKLGSLATHWAQANTLIRSESLLGAQSFCWFCQDLTHFMVTIYTSARAQQNRKKWSVQPANTQTSLGTRLVWLKSSLCNLWVPKNPNLLQVDSEDSHLTERMPRLIWVFAEQTGQLACFVVLRLTYWYNCLSRSFLWRTWPAGIWCNWRSCLFYPCMNPRGTHRSHRLLNCTGNLTHIQLKYWIWANSWDYGTYRPPSVNSIFKHPCAAIHWGYTSDFWSDPSSTSIRYVWEQRRLWRGCAVSPEPSLFAYAISTIISWAGSFN